MHMHRGWGWGGGGESMRYSGKRTGEGGGVVVNFESIDHLPTVMRI